MRGRGLPRISSFNAAGVRYLIVGSYAVMVHTELRYTKDLDLWIEPVEQNAGLMSSALTAFGVAAENRPRCFAVKT